MKAVLTQLFHIREFRRPLRRLQQMFWRMANSGDTSEFCPIE
jgi:hypothetical protein